MTDEREPSLLDRTERATPAALFVCVLLALVSHALASLAALREPTPAGAGIALVAIAADAFLVPALLLGQVRLGAALLAFAAGICASVWADHAGDRVLVARAASAAAPALVLLASASWGWWGRRSIDGASAPESLARWLGSARRDLVDAAVDKLGAAFEPEATARALEPVLATGGRAGVAAVAAALELGLRDEGRAPAVRALAGVAGRGDPTTAWAAALALAEIGADREIRALLDETRDPHRRAALVEALAETDGAEEEAARAAVALVVDPSAPVDARAHALSVVDDERFLRHARTPLRDALARTSEPTEEALAVLELAGMAEDAPLAGRFVASRSYPLSDGALVALEKIVERDPPRGLARAATRAALASARDWMRTFHPPKDNALADQLIERIEKLERELA